MSEHLQRDWKRLGAAMQPQWTPERASEIKMRIALRHREQKWRRITATATAIVILSGVATLSLLLGESHGVSSDAPPPASDALSPASDALSPASADTLSPVSDSLSPSAALSPPLSQQTGESTEQMKGNRALSTDRPALSSLATALTPGTRFTVEEGADSRTYQITGGAVRFDTGADKESALVVRVGTLVIEDIGTVFTVEALPDKRALVAVSEGRVRVTWPAGQAEVAAGEEGLFPPDKNIAAKADTPNRATFPSPGEAPQDWRQLARRGNYQPAFRIIEANPSLVLNRVDDLLLAADVMRLSGRPKQAVSYLERILSGHGRDPRADLAAFTLGRVFLDELGRPGQAARAFAAAGRRGSPLAEEALAREVEAWSRAGEVDRAHAAAATYLQKYPSGPRIDVVRAFGGLRAP